MRCRADVQDTFGAQVLLQQCAAFFPRLIYIWVDNGYRGRFIAAVQQQFGMAIEVVQHDWKEAASGRWMRADAPAPTASIPKGFQVFPLRFVVERTFTWFGLFRRLSRTLSFIWNAAKRSSIWR